MASKKSVNGQTKKNIRKWRRKEKKSRHRDVEADA